MTDHVRSYRVEPDRAFADRLERELVRRLEVHGDAAVGLLAADGAAIDVPATERYVTELGRERGEQRHRSWRSRPVTVGAAAAVVVAAVVAAAVVTRRDADVGRATELPGNGLIAFVGESDENPATSDIYVAAPDGTGLRALTSTPEFVEYAPAWSPDGSRLAFVRSTDEEWSPSNGSFPCRTNCQLVVIDPSTGVETFSADIKEVEPVPDSLAGLDLPLVPQSLAWSPDGRAIAISSNPRDGIGNVGPGSSRIVDLETGTYTTFTPPSDARWSPDGDWLALLRNSDPRASLLLVPADLIPTGDVIDVTALGGARPLPERDDDSWWGTVDWMPDASALVFSLRDQIEVMTVANGERRTLIVDGFDPAVSPDGSQIAYSRGDPAPGGHDEIWIAAADGSEPRRVTRSSTPAAWSPDGSLLLASDEQGWFTVRPDGTDRTPLGIRDHSPSFPRPRTVSSGIDWQPAGAQEP
jgi:Tol biopolymer transport system component